MVRENHPFTVISYPGAKEYKAVCIASDGEGCDKYTIKILSKDALSKEGHTFTVEEKWFDEEETGRQIIYD